MSTSEVTDLERKLSAEKARHHESKGRKTKEIIWTAVIASVISVIVLTSLGWLTTQSVVRNAREDGGKGLVALRASICLVRFQQRPDSAANLTALNTLSWGEKETAVRKLVTDEKLATMLGEDAPAAGAIDKCVDAIARS